jgi:hypothetical protein
MLREIGRRTFLWLLGASGAAVGLGGLAGCRTPGKPQGSSPAGRFFSTGERRTLDALAEALVPEDATVGARGAGAVDYVERLLAAFDAPVPDLYRGGPFSDRNPIPDPHTGQPGSRRPSNGFLEVVPPTRLQTLAFRALLDGPQSLAGVPVTAELLPPQGLRALYREGLAALDAAARGAGEADFAALDPAARLAAFEATGSAFQEAVLSHLAEGMFCPPEYGGNRDAVAWRDYHYGGDSQPLGYTLWDRAHGRLYDRADRPNQTADPALPGGSFEPAVLQMLEQMVVAQGGKRYF